MPALTKGQALVKLADAVRSTRPDSLSEIRAELFPENPPEGVRSAEDLSRHILSGLEVEEILDLWNVVFPADRNVTFDDDDNRIHYDGNSMSYSEVEAD